jgi:SpoVK/Ycf46/Vps4 family AAA+-type ATPase
VDLPTAEARAQIAAIHLKKRGQDPAKFDLPAIAAVADGYSGAEIEQGIVSALHECVAGKAELCTAAVLETLRHSPPLSVTMAEKVETLRAWAEGRTVPAD